MSEAISYLNDLDNDKRYSKWSKSFDDSNFDEGKYCAINLLTVIVPINFEDHEISSLLESLIQMVSFGYPIRFAVLPVVPSSMKPEDLNEKIKPWINAYYAVRESYGLRASISFLRNSIQMYQSDPKNSKNFIDFLLLQLNLKIDLKKGEKLTQEAEIICKNFKINDSEIFLNGLPILITRNLPDILMNNYFTEYDLILNNEELRTSKNLYESILRYHKAKDDRFSIDENIRYKNDHLLPIESLKKLLNIKGYFVPNPEK